MTDSVSQPHGVRIDALRAQPDLEKVLDAIFGADEDDVEAVLERARRMMPRRRGIVWQADPLTFTFTYVSSEAEDLLGYPASRWYDCGFWRDKVVHPDDVRDAVSHCAIATAAGVDHDFEYRAQAADGSVLRVHDVVHVLKGPLGFASCLRGIMFPVEETEP